MAAPRKYGASIFPFLFGRAFIEADYLNALSDLKTNISLPFRKGFH